MEGNHTAKGEDMKENWVVRTYYTNSQVSPFTVDLHIINCQPSPGFELYRSVGCWVFRNRASARIFRDKLEKAIDYEALSILDDNDQIYKTDLSLDAAVQELKNHGFDKKIAPTTDAHRGQ